MILNLNTVVDTAPAEPFWAQRYPAHLGEDRFQLQMVDEVGLPTLHLIGLTRVQMEQLGRAVAAALAGDTPTAAEADDAHVR